MELEKGLTTVWKALSRPTLLWIKSSHSLIELIKLLSKVEQSPANSMLIARLPLMIAEDFLKHSDVEVKVGGALVSVKSLELLHQFLHMFI